MKRLGLGKRKNGKLLQKNGKLLQMMAVLCMAAVLLAGCGSKKGGQDITVDIKNLAAQLNGAVTSDTLSQAQADMIPKIYYFDEDSYVSGEAYVSAGTTACEVAVIECKDAAGAGEAAEKLKERVSSQKELYASYNADEAGRLDKAIVKNAGKYAVLAVVDDTEGAEKMLQDAGF